MVTTFQLQPNGHLVCLGQHANMSQASAELPSGAYTTFRTYEGSRVLRLGQHVRRLEESLALMGCPAALDVAVVQRGIAEAIQHMAYLESRFRLTFAPPNLYISIEPFHPYPASLYETGVWCVTVPLRRDNPHAKSTAFISAASSAYQSLPSGAHEGLMIAEDGAILEGLSSNFFAILDEAMPEGNARPVLYTEAERVLLGVTRALVLEVAAEVVQIVERAPHLSDAPRFKEAFITSVSREILPVTRIDQTVIGEGVPGGITRELIARFRSLVEREARSVFEP